MTITRELLEHYLRAIGLDVKHLPRCGEFIPWIAQQQKLPERDVAYRLGLCAAAEHLIEAANVDQASADASTPGSSNAAAYGLTAATLRLKASVLLTMAGVDPARWEEARR